MKDLAPLALLAVVAGAALVVAVGVLGWALVAPLVYQW